jgi:EAL domain-containing protein (putative c-di-GMP-specific phosphodiesterase class I)
LRGNGAFALQLNVETILSADFLRLDEALPLALRGPVILKIDAIDLLSDAANYEFARRFAQARGYRIALACAGLGLLAMLDLARLEPDIVHVPWSPDLAAAPGAARLRVPARASIVLEGLDRASQAEWAAKSGFTLGSGNALSC